jgi:hypothetical protein
MLSCLVNSRFQFTLTTACEEHRKNGCRPSPLPTDHYSLPTIFFLFTFLQTLLHLANSHLLCFHAIPHSFAKTPGGGCTLPLNRFAHPSEARPAPMPLLLSRTTGHGTRSCLSVSVIYQPWQSWLWVPVPRWLFHRTKLLRPRNIK